MDIEHFHSFKDRPSLISAGLDFCRTALTQALAEKGEASLIGAGGSTPAPLYEHLAEQDLDWTNVLIGLSDERWVPITHHASNGAMVQATLLQKHAAKAKFIPLSPSVNEAKTAPEADTLKALAQSYSPLTETPDLVILGMGSDAHTLSWFPQADGLETALDPTTSQTVCPIFARASRVTGEITTRLTLTYPVIARARHVLLLITGAEKRRVLEEAGPETPVAHMMQAAGTRLCVYWSP